MKKKNAVENGIVSTNKKYLTDDFEKKNSKLEA